MVDPKAVDWKHAHKRRMTRRMVMGCTPPRWRRFFGAGAATCYCIRAMVQSAQHTQEGEDEHDST
jgi:uncharacterized cupin superfamily protein